MNISVKAIYDSLTSKGIDVEKVGLPQADTLLLFDYLGAKRAVQGTIPDLTSSTGRDIAHNKDVAAKLAELLAIASPVTVLSSSFSQAVAFLEQYKQIVVKPSDGAHGYGISTNITSSDLLKKAIVHARRMSPTVILQQQVTGSDVRVLVIGGKLAAIAQRVPATVTGDGRHTVKQLINIENTTNPDRGIYYQKPLNYIDKEAARMHLRNNIRRTPEQREIVQVVGTANLGTGGSSLNRTTDRAIPNEMIRQAVSFAKNAAIFTCAVDFMFDETTGRWYFIEVNANPGFVIHWYPTNGEGVDITEIFVSRLLLAYEQSTPWNQ